MRQARHFLFGIVTAITLALSATNASAHAHLETSTPTANAAVASPATITLRFTEPLEARFSGFEVADARGRAVRVSTRLDEANHAILVGTPVVRLPPGAYRVSWHIVAHDGHRMRGTFNFTVQP